MAKSDRPRPHAAIGRRLKQIRRAHRCTQEEMAAALGVSQSTYNPWETGTRMMPAETAIVLREQFKASLDYLYTGDHGGLEFRLWHAIEHNRPLD